MHTMTSDLAQTKAVRRKALREAFPHPLNQVALRHIDSAAALDDAHRLILSRAIQKTDLRYVGMFLETLNKDVHHLQNEDDLVALVPAIPVSKVEVIRGLQDTARVNPVDIDILMNLLLKCYPDMLLTNADALARSELNQVGLDIANRTNSFSVLYDLSTERFK